MNIETAKELKALQKGYTSWRWLVDTYSRYDNAVGHIDEYLREAYEWVKNGISPDEMDTIENNIQIFGSKYADEIRDRLEITCNITATNENVVKLINLVKSIK